MYLILGLDIGGTKTALALGERRTDGVSGMASNPTGEQS
jgi:N-acetylglucosamine kinase-like BadF-type ATPase